jgi:8-oxo-dGTP pyrophosphatase MutT (NUDIX family)
MTRLQKTGPEEIVYKGKIFEIVKQPMKAGDKRVVFEIARRSPGTRLLIVKNNQLLIAKEFRSELNDYDYRLPGGKVFDTLEEYNRHRTTDILPFAVEAAKRECKEETGLVAKKIKYFATAQSGATVVWDLIYFIIDEFEENKKGQELEVGEVVNIEWKSFKEVKKMCKEGDISEDRTLGILFKFFLQYPKNYIN